MTREVRSLVKELKQELAKVYGRRLRGVYLYGSHARGTQEPESDVDVLIVLDEIDSYDAEIRRTSEIISALSLEHGVSISRVFASESRWLNDRAMFFVNAREEAIRA